MGVPGFYRWAVRRVPGLKQTASSPPYEVDNLYLDFNGTVHGCIDAWSGQQNEEVLYGLIEAQVAFLLSIVQPQVLLVIALDGVAPRAKMNQQRSRRFRAAQERQQMADTLEEFAHKFDRNAITPGTGFMVRLTARLYAWAETAAQTMLSGVAVVVSGAGDPGEGEHKIMEIMRHHPERSHCLCSNDADLVFLGLVSGSAQVYLLREKNQNRRGPGGDQGAVASTAVATVAGDAEDAARESAAGDATVASTAVSTAAGDAEDAARESAAGDATVEELAQEQESETGNATANAEDVDSAMLPVPGATAAAVASERFSGSSARDFELLSIGALREWLASQFPDCDVQRVAADFVAMCCLAGNDFLPHIPAVDIYEGGIDRLLTAYHGIEPAEHGHLVSGDTLSLELPRWRCFLERFAKVEAESLLDCVHLGLGDAKTQKRGPGPPDNTWDGLSVFVSYVHPQAAAKDVQTGLSKHGCSVHSVCQLKRRGGPRSPGAWLVRFSDPWSALKTLVSIRRVFGRQVDMRWARNIAELEFAESAPEAAEAVDWQPALAQIVRENFEYWLGSENLKKDPFLRRQCRAREDRFIPIKIFLSFNRMRTWLQDIGLITEILRGSSLLEVRESSGSSCDDDGPMVRGVEDHSLRPGESPEELACQHQAVAAVMRGDYQSATLALRHEHYSRKAGPVATGSPPPEDLAAVERHRSRAFLTGVEWVLRYYIRGCPSWSWFYPAHYPPLCSSLASCADEALIPPPLHMPFPPALQLLAVLPPQSAELLPERLQSLLLDSSSPVLDFYPSSFNVDLKEGDKEWQAIVLLPFVDEVRLRAALAEIEGSDAAHDESARAFLVHPSTIADRLQQPECQDRVAAAADTAAATAASDVSTGVAGPVTTWDFRPDGELPEGRAGTGRSIADQLAAAAARNTAARVAAANARSEAAIARAKSTASRQNQGGRGRGRSGRGRNGRSGEQGRPSLGPGSEETRAAAHDEQQTPVVQQEEEANEGMATAAALEHLEQKAGPVDVDNADNAAAQTEATQGSDATSSCTTS